MRTSALPVVAIVGRPNVGKSSLVNRILGRRDAIVQETPGVTRDRRSFTADWAGRRFEIIDTGGLEPGAAGLEADVAEQAHIAIAAADVIVLVVDVVVGPTQDDHEVAHILRRAEKPVLLAANKADDPSDEPSAAAFHRLGLGDPIALSALHGRGSGDFLEALVARLPDAPADDPEGPWASIAIVGRPNVGKSSLLNALVGERRAIVAPSPGTTRDPVDAELVAGEGRHLRLLDTAGMRREVRIQDPIEYFAWLRSRQTLERADVALLVVDAVEGVTGHDQRIAEAVVEAGRACVVVLNKWDLVTRDVPTGPDRDRHERDLTIALRWLPWAPRLRISALTGRGIDRIPAALEAAVESHRRRLGTAVVNEIIGEAQDRRPPPRRRGRFPRVRYAVQAGVAPPTFVLFANALLDDSYVRYLEHRIRDVEPFEGTPVRIVVRSRSDAQSPR